MAYDVTQLYNALKQRYGWAAVVGGGKDIVYSKCPVCGKKKLYVHSNTGYYKCWRGCCSGKIQDLLSGIHLSHNAAQAPVPEEPMRWRDPGYVMTLTSLPPTHQAITYLVKRGFSPAQLEQDFGVAYCECGNEFAQGRYNTSNSLLFPIKYQGQLVAWQSRLLYDPDSLSVDECLKLGMKYDEDGDLMRYPKYFTMPSFRKGSLFFNYDQAKAGEIVVVTEGTFDAMAVGKCAVACLGKGVSSTQVSMLAANWKLAVLLLDPDAEAENHQLQTRLAVMGMTSVCVKLDNDLDAGETPRASIWAQIYRECMAAQVDLTKYKAII